MILPPLTIEEVARYSRHLLLPQIGVRGQQRLKAASVLIVGMGGLGSPIAAYLAAAGIGKLGLVDYDRVELSNLQRQILYSVQQEGEQKAVCAAERVRSINPEIEVNAFPLEFNAGNAREISAGYDILVDGTDNIPTRYLLNDLAVLTEKTYVYGSIFRFEGQVSVFGVDDGPCYRCLFSEPPPPGVIPSCSSVGVMGVLPGIIGSIQAAEVIKLVTGAGSPLIGKLLLFDALDMSAEVVKVRKKQACQICGAQPIIKDLIDYEAWCRTGIQEEFEQLASEWDIEPLELMQLLDSEHPPLLLDVREEFERAISALSGAVAIPLPDLENRLTELLPGCEVVIFCRNGVRSRDAARLLTRQGFSRVHSLRGGINAWALQVDSRLLIY